MSTNAKPTNCGLVPTIADAKAMGAKGGPTIEAERLAFEAWVEGHNWSMGNTMWIDDYYRSVFEVGGVVDPFAVEIRRMWAAWRDRAALGVATSNSAPAVGDAPVMYANADRTQAISAESLEAMRASNEGLCPAIVSTYTVPMFESQQVTQGDTHPDDLAVDRFAAALKEKLATARAKGRGGWEDKTLCSQTSLSEMLIEHIAKGDPRDVANFCMMLWNRGEPIVSNPPKKQADAFLHNGKRVEWQDSVGKWHTGTITGYNPATYNADLDDGTQAEGYARGRFREIADQQKAQGDVIKAATDKLISQWNLWPADARRMVELIAPIFAAQAGGEG